ncbi:MAG: TetR/AcrR family transcriptional regulator [Acidobacteriia bacterium]|nr:TetR/AcrR family transcriptional regulator [Terriglobia bacterium]
MTSTLSETDGRLLKGNETRSTILQVAVQIASAEGLEGLSLGRLATEVGMSKSGLFAHFRSKEDLQVAVVDAASELFVQEVILPAQSFPAGLQRLRSLAENWLSYAGRRVFRGGCFFFAASMEFDSRPGVVRERVKSLMLRWLQHLESEIRNAREAHELRPDADERQLAFEFNAQMMGANWAHQLMESKQALERARTAIIQRIESFAVQPT